MRASSKKGIRDKTQPFAAVSAEKKETIVKLQLTKEEASAIEEYANCCGESLPELIRKALIREATLADGFGADDPQYEYRFKLPVGVHTASFSDTRVRDLVEDNYNHIRSILGWRRIKF